MDVIILDLLLIVVFTATFMCVLYFTIKNAIRNGINEALEYQKEKNPNNT